MKFSNNLFQEKGHGYFRKRNKVLVSMITVFGSLMLSSVALADEVASTTTSTTTTEAPTTVTTTTEAPTTVTTTTEGPSTVVTTENTTTTEEKPELPNTGTTNYNLLVVIASVLLVGAYAIVRKEVK